MNKSELIKGIAQELGIPLQKASPIIDTMLKAMISSLVAGGSIEIRGFGSFGVKKYRSYEGRNPKTGEKIKVAPKKLPVFKVSKALKEQVKD